MTGSLAFTIRKLRMSMYIFHMCIMWCSVCPFAEMACKSCIGLWVTKYRNTLLIPLGTHLKGSGPTSCSYKPGGFGKNLQNELGQVKIVHTKWWRFVQEKAETQHNICRFQSSIWFWLWALLALGTWTPKRSSFCRNVLLCFFLAFSSLSPQLSLYKQQPIPFVRKWVHWCLPPFILQCGQRVKRWCPPFCPRFVFERQADSDKWHGVAFWYLTSCNSCLACCLRILARSCKISRWY